MHAGTSQDSAPAGGRPKAVRLSVRVALVTIAIVCLILATCTALAQGLSGGGASAAGVSERAETAEAGSPTKSGGATAGAASGAAQKAEADRLARERAVPVDLGPAAPAGADANAARQQGFGATLFGAILNLGLVIGLIYAIYWVARLIRREPPRAGSGGRLIQVLESARLGPDRSVHLVTIGGRVLMVGSSPGGLTLLAEIDDEEVTRAVASGARSAFARELAHIAGDEDAVPPAADGDVGAVVGPSGRAAAALSRAAGLIGSLSRRGGRR